MNGKRLCTRGALAIVVLSALALSWLGGCARVVRAEDVAEGAKVASSKNVVIDDFTSENGTSRLGTSWQKITDQVMGGVSTATTSLETIDGRRALRLRGKVSLENNGGFIQARLPLEPKGRMVDASGFKGVRLTVRGNGETYSVHLRTARTWLPWQYFHATFPTTERWEKVELPFSEFKGESFKLSAALDPGKLKTIAIVAIKKAFQADVAVSHLEFYR